MFWPHKLGLFLQGRGPRPPGPPPPAPGSAPKCYLLRGCVHFGKKKLNEPRECLFKWLCLINIGVGQLVKPQARKIM